MLTVVLCGEKSSYNNINNTMISANENYITALRLTGRVAEPDFYGSYVDYQTPPVSLASGHSRQKWKANKIKEFFFPSFKFEAWRDRIFGRTVTKEIEILAGEVLVAHDNTFVQDLDLPQVPDDSISPIRHRNAYVADLVARCKIAIPGVTEYNKANVLVAHKFLVGEMEAHGMRPQHIKRMLPLAKKMVFIPDCYEIEAEQISQSLVMQRRVQEGQVKYYARTDPWIFNWFGTRSRRADPATA